MNAFKQKQKYTREYLSLETGTHIRTGAVSNIPRVTEVKSPPHPYPHPDTHAVLSL